MNIFSILIPKHTLTYLNANDPLDQAVAFLLGATYTAIPVVDDQGRYVGSPVRVISCVRSWNTDVRTSQSIR